MLRWKWFKNIQSSKKKKEKLIEQLFNVRKTLWIKGGLELSFQDKTQQMTPTSLRQSTFQSQTHT